MHSVDNLGDIKIKVFGVGGGGGNAVDKMIRSVLYGVDLVAVNTDMQELNRSKADFKIQLGDKLARGLSAEGDPEAGRDAAYESIEQIKEQVDGCEMVFVAAGMGGGTGTGATPVIAKVAREAGALTVGVVTKPFHFEGKKRLELAERGINELKQCVDSLICISNNRLISLDPKKSTSIDLFNKADEAVCYAVKGITDLILVQGLICICFDDVKSVMSESGLAAMGIGIARGESRAKEAAMMAISNQLLEGVSIDSAKGVLMNITCGMDLTIDEVQKAATTIYEAAHEDANIFFGTFFDKEETDEIRVTVIATGLELKHVARNAPSQQPKTV